VTATAAVAIVAIAMVVMAALFVITRRSSQPLTTPTERAVHATLHTASRAARPLRRGLDETSAAEAAPHLRSLIGAEAMIVADAEGHILANTVGDGDLAAEFGEASRRAIDGERRVLVRLPASGDTPARALIVQPVVTDGAGVSCVLGAVTDAEPSPGMIGACTEVARYVGEQIELAELDAARGRLDRAEVRALRAQISPHFVYNSLTTVASFVRTDPDRARELVLEFADFTRYSFRNSGEYTVLSDELRNIDRYLTLERARFGDALDVTLQIAPEVLNVVVPFLALQPLVENAVRHGVAGRGSGRITIIAADEGTDAVISVEDDGVGMDPELLRSGSIDSDEGMHVGLANVDDRLRATFGNDYGLVVETAPEAGTKVSMRIPKFRHGIRA
jgi:two-component system LytT family sensor kinase